MEFQAILNKAVLSQELDEDEARLAMQLMMEGKIENEKMAAFLTALKMRGESAGEIASFARVMRQNARTIRAEGDYLVDTCGTGGDGRSTFNVSTCAAFVAAGAGCQVAKHGNRASSSKSGSADALEALGVKVGLGPQECEKQLQAIGITFLFAPAFHPAMKNVGPVRKALGFKTVFNILGPLTNPAGVRRQVIGVYDKKMAGKMAEVLQKLGVERALVVSSDTDEISISDETQVHEVEGGKIKTYSISPEKFGIKKASLDELKADEAAASSRIILEVLSGKSGPARDIVLLNAGAAIYAAGKADSLEKGMEMATQSIDSGAAMKKLEQMRKFA
ncbi:Anthranilate phosphoribosyltransferase [uncultured archaeon]|nr:Anthranilate phosphoribosyltransferase [uncultured archaeon]